MDEEDSNASFASTSMTDHDIYDQLDFRSPSTSKAASPECSSPAPPTSLAITKLTLLDGEYFKIIEEKSSGRHIVAECTKCPVDSKSKVVKGFNNTTSNFLSHLKRVHGDGCVSEYQKYAKKKKSDEIEFNKRIHTHQKTQPSKTEKYNDQYNQETFDSIIVRYFINSMIPLRAVEDEHFGDIFDYLKISDKGLKLFSRRTLGRRIDSKYEEEMTKIKNEIQNIDYVCTTTDIWSTKKRSFIGITAHWINNNLQRVSAALACQRFPGTHSYDRIYEILRDINSEFDLTEDKHVASITDNGSNFVKAFQTFGVQLSNIAVTDDESDGDTDDETVDIDEYILERNFDIHSLSGDKLPVHLRCAAHTLSLCATSDANKILSEKNSTLAEMHASVMKKCNALWKAAGRPKSAELIQEVLKHTLHRPGETRWNSLFDALQQIYKIRDKSAQLHKALNIKTPLKEIDFEYINEYLTIAGPVAEALDIMQGQNNTYYGIVLPCLLALRKKLRKLEKKTDFKFCKKLLESYKESVQNRFAKYFNVNTPESQNAAIAALSYPRTKNKWLNCLEVDDRAKVKKIFQTIISKQLKEKAPEEKKIQTSTAKQESAFLNFSDSDSDASTTGADRADAPLSKAELLMLHYFAEDEQELELLNRYPDIKNVFFKYNTPLPSSAAVERLFSYATMTNLKGQKLSDSLFEKRVILKANLSYETLNKKNKP